MIHLIISGEEIITTVDHPFYVQGRGFIEAGNLLIGDKLVSAIGEDLLIEDYHIELAEESISVYNFQVEDFHTYHVGTIGVLVHNANYQEVNPKNLEPTHNQTKSNRQMNKLIDQIRQNGIQETIKYVVDGHHRLIAAKRLGLISVPVEEVELPYGGYKSIDDLNYDIY